MLLKAILIALCAISLPTIRGMSVPEGNEEITTKNTLVKKYNYNKDLILDNTSVKKLDINKKTGNIYILDTYSKLYVLRKGENQTQPIIIPETVINTITVDQSTGLLFIGCNNGVKIYNERNKRTKQIQIITEDIQELFISNVAELYVVTQKEHKVYKYKDYETAPASMDITVSEIGFGNFVVDFNGNYYFNSHDDSKTTTRVNANSASKIEYAGESNANYYMAVDGNGTVYGISSFPHQRLYRLKNDSIPELVAILDFIPNSMCFDENNNPVFATSNDIFVLTFKKDLSCNDTLFEFVKKMDVRLESKSDTNNKEILNLLAELKKSQDAMANQFRDLSYKISNNTVNRDILEDRINSLEKKNGNGNGGGCCLGNVHQLVFNGTDREVSIAIHNVGKLTVNSPNVEIITNKRDMNNTDDSDQ